MSQWTHIAGIVRVDSAWGIALKPDRTKDLLQEIFSKPPSGSEGPALIGIIETREHNSLSWGFVSIAGDLRDVGEAESIVQWFKGCLSQFHENKMIVRDAVLSIDIEYKDKVLLILDPNRDAVSGKAEVVEHRIKRADAEPQS